MNKTNIDNTLKSLLMTVVLISAAPVLAAEMDHGQHMKMGKSMDQGMDQKMDQNMNHSAMQGKMQESTSKSSSSLEMLTHMPASGHAREGGSDGRPTMESIDLTDSQATRCAQASRGLVMLDNAAWSRCGGKPGGAAHGPQAVGAKEAAMDGHAGHSM